MKIIGKTRNDHTPFWFYNPAIDSKKNMEQWEIIILFVYAGNHATVSVFLHSAA